jgi:membrane-associated protein
MRQLTVSRTRCAEYIGRVRQFLTALRQVFAVFFQRAPPGLDTVKCPLHRDGPVTAAFTAARMQVFTMELLRMFVDVVLHLDKHLTELVAAYQYWVYGILFLIIFAETGLVVTPFLPGDSLLFAVGALAAVDQTSTLHAPIVWVLLMVAAVLGNETNFRIGGFIGPKAFSGQFRWLKQDYLLKTQAFYDKHGGMAIVLSRFLPIIRTFAPFVAGVGRMRPLQFLKFNLLGGIGWVTAFIWGGYLFGNVPIIKNNFGVVTIIIIIVSLLPLLWAALTSVREPAK